MLDPGLERQGRGSCLGVDWAGVRLGRSKKMQYLD